MSSLTHPRDPLLEIQQRHGEVQALLSEFGELVTEYDELPHAVRSNQAMLRPFNDNDWPNRSLLSFDARDEARGDLGIAVDDLEGLQTSDEMAALDEIQQKVDGLCAQAKSIRIGWREKLELPLRLRENFLAMHRELEQLLKKIIHYFGYSTNWEDAWHQQLIEALSSPDLPLVSKHIGTSENATLHSWRTLRNSLKAEQKPDRSMLAVDVERLCEARRGDELVRRALKNIMREFADSEAPAGGSEDGSQSSVQGQCSGSPTQPLASLVGETFLPAVMGTLALSLPPPPPPTPSSDFWFGTKYVKFVDGEVVRVVTLFDISSMQLWHYIQYTAGDFRYDRDERHLHSSHTQRGFRRHTVTLTRNGRKYQHSVDLPCSRKCKGNLAYPKPISVLVKIEHAHIRAEWPISLSAATSPRPLRDLATDRYAEKPVNFSPKGSGVCKYGQVSVYGAVSVDYSESQRLDLVGCVSDLLDKKKDENISWQDEADFAADLGSGGYSLGVEGMDCLVPVKYLAHACEEIFKGSVSRYRAMWLLNYHSTDVQKQGWHERGLNTNISIGGHCHDQAVSMDKGKPSALYENYWPPDRTNMAPGWG